MRYAIAVFILVPGMFLMWAAWKALRISGHEVKVEAKQMTRNRRRVYWTWIVFLPTSIILGGILGAVLKPSRGLPTGSFAGVAIGAAVALVVSIPVGIYLGRTKRPPSEQPYSQETTLLPHFGSKR